MSHPFIFNGLVFVADETALKQQTQAKGFYQRISGGFLLSDLQHEPKALVCVKGRERFTVTAFKFDNTLRFMFSTTAITERFLGADNLGYSDNIELSEKAVNQFLANSDQLSA